MDQVNTCIGLRSLAGSKPKSLVEWNAQYEAMSLENDWWFKAAVVVSRWVRKAVNAIASAQAQAPQLAHA